MNEEEERSMPAQISIKKDKIKPLSINGNNQLIGYYDMYAIVYDVEEEEFFYFFMPQPIDSLLFSCVEKEILNPVSSLPEEMQLGIQRKFLEE